MAQTPTPTIASPAGKLEASYHEPAQARNAALLCHPHPSYGGNMHDGVLAIAASALDELSDKTPDNGWAHLRFNFRGVGASAGSYDNGQGEQDDLAAAWDWLRAKNDWTRLVLIGYSFGSAMAWSAYQRCQDVSQLLLIAPPTAAMPFADTASGNQAPAPHIIVGEQDDYCDRSKLPTDSQVIVLPQTDHFFSGAGDALKSAIVSITQ